MVDKSDRRVLATATGALGSNTLLDNPDCPEFYVEGVGQFALGPSVSKIRFFKVNYGEQTGHGITHEEREISLSVAIPTASLLEWVSSIRAALPASIDALENASKITLEMLRAAAK
jgi:hypothetical protein